MSLLRCLVPPLAFLVLGASTAGDDPAFSPGRHTVLTKSFAEDTALEVDSFEVLLDGQPMQQELPEVTMEGARRMVLSDEYIAVADGRVRTLERTLDRVAAEFTVVVDDGGEREEHTVASSSELEEALVRFEWDEEEEEYNATFEEGGTGEDEHLAAMVAELDFLAFLPDGSVDEDDEWEIDAAALGRVFIPGGDLRLLPDGLGDEPYVNMEVPAMVASTLSHLGEAGSDWGGDVKARYTGNTEVDGTRVGRIELGIDVTTVVDLKDRIQQVAEHLGDIEVDFTALSFSWSLDGTGELLWDLEAGHAHSFLLEAEVVLEAELGWSQPFFDQELGLEGIYELSGTTRYAMTLDG